MKDTNCPYCDADVEINHDDGYGYGEDEVYQQECGNCEKTFVYTTSISYYYEPAEAPCLNGGEHDLREIHSSAPEFYKNKRRCNFCDETITIETPDKES